MKPLGSGVEAAAESSLCRECGICCGWALFHVVALAPSEIGWAAARRLPLFQNGPELSFELPCPVLEAHGNARVCGDYEHRPAACRAFECKVLSRFKSGALTKAEALDLVGKARTLIAQVDERIAGAAKTTDAVATRAALSAVIWGGSREALDTETLLDLGVLESLILPTFHDHRKPEETGLPEESSLMTSAEKSRTI
jgi:Fe-S-cluster containining protein